ncbi:MAG: NAD-dependent epimerase/dehydratase family protein [Actinomycetota bacterium]|nr:NAD-dependent epimerase/dehydratase family protein [Actinomycetota bacterium]
MKALVTGGAGFIGSHLTEYLLDHGHEVLSMDDLSTGSLRNIAHLRGHDRLRFVEGSVLDSVLMDELAANSDTIFHLAAAVGVKTIIDDPLGGLRTNLRGTETVLESAERHGARVLVASTSEVYGHNTSDALVEEDLRILGSPLISRWSYAEAKALDETLAYFYWRYKGVATVIVRPFNIVGPRQTGRYGMVIPRFVSQALRGEPLTVYGDGTQTRCFCHVREVVGAFVDLIEHPRGHGKVFNLGRPEEVSIHELAERVIDRTASSSSIRLVPYTEAYPEGFEDMSRRVPDVSRARALVGFDPKLGLDEILSSVIDDQLKAESAGGSSAGEEGFLIPAPVGMAAVSDLDVR